MHRNFSRQLTIGLVGAILLSNAPAQPPPPPPPAEVGARIGNIITSAVNTAFPVVGTVISAVQALFKKGDKKDDQQVAAIKAAVDAEVKKGAERAATAMKPLKEISGELEPVLTALELTAKLQPALTKILVLTDPKTSLQKTDPRWAEITYTWNAAEPSLKQLSSINAKGLKDNYLKLTIEELTTIDRDGLITNAKLAMGGTKSQDLAGFVSTMLNRMDKVPALGGYLVTDLINGVAGVEGQIKGAQGPGVSLEAQTRARHLQAFKQALNAKP
jgi:hypothetical protein